MKKNSGLYIALVVLVVGGGAFYLWTSGAIPGPNAKAPAAGAPPPASVSVAPALEKTVTEWDEFSGRVRAIDRVEIRPRSRA